MNKIAPRADVGGAALSGAFVLLLGLFIVPPEIFDANAVFGAIGIILPFAAGWIPRKYKSVWMLAVSLIAVVLTALLEFLFTGEISEATKTLTITITASTLSGYVIRPTDPDDPVLERASTNFRQ